MTTNPIFPINVYGSNISYFTGKLENYFRIKGIPYQAKALEETRYAQQIKDKVGSRQMPAMELADGRWMTDTTAIIQWFEENHPTPAVTPIDPLQRFFSLLLEDYADEWLWRPAMHYRWYYKEGARHSSGHLAEELAPNINLPAFLKRWKITRRQRQGYTMGDGITHQQVPGVEAIFLRTLDQLEAIFSRRAFMLGDKPSLADIGFSGPFFRHFALDPIPAEIVRQRAPAVYEWVARLWNIKLDDCSGTLIQGVPEDWGPILKEIGSDYLPYLCANVDAVAAGKERFDTEIGGVAYRGARWSKYRCWCLQRLREHFNALPATDQSRARALLEQHGCWEPLWRQEILPIEASLCSQLPFRTDANMTGVYE